MASHHPFRYRPLESVDTIRLLVLAPANSTKDPLNCTILHCKRDSEEADYCAVSYAWGEPIFARFVKIHSDHGERKLKITRTVDALLRRMRDIGACRLWIDCLCLNQQDTGEKASQIPLMGCIYRAAKMVHIWLGEADKFTESTFKGLEFHISNSSDFNPSQRIKSFDDMYANAVVLKQKLRDHGIDEFAMEWGRLCLPSKPWFMRRWIIQEVCLARHALVHCGRFSITFERLLKAAQILVDGGLIVYSQIARLRPQCHEPSILELLFKFDWAECSDNRDRIAALMAFLSEQSRIPLDYTSHWTQLYRQTAEYVLMHGGQTSGLELLRHLFEFGRIKYTEQFSGPSWVPDWSKSRQAPFTYDLLDGSKLGFWRPQHPVLNMELPAATSATLWEGMLQIAWDDPNFDVQKCCQKVDRVHDFNASAEKSVPKDERIENLFTLMETNYGRPFPDTSLIVLILTIGELADGLNETTTWAELKRDMFFALSLRQDTGTHVFICSLQRSEGCSHHGKGPLNAHFCISKEHLLPGDYLVPLWKDPPIHKAWSKLAGPFQGRSDEVSRLATMKMLVVRETGEPSARERLAHDEYLVAKGEVVGCAVAIYVQEDEYVSNTNIGITAEVKQKKDFRRCSMLLN